MAEFVERELEQLLPVFEQLKLTQLITADELSEFIDQCRAFEYKCAKRTKRAKDFLTYAHYMADKLEAIGKRRRELKYMHRYDEIERPLKRKCAFIHRICSHRFRKLEYHREEIAFLRRAKMFKTCSQAYTRLLQIHGHLVSNHEEAARFEFFDNNHSADSARAILSVGLRKFPTHPRLWLTHFEIELRYVEFLHQRRQFLLHGKRKKKMKHNDQQRGEEAGESEQRCLADDDVLDLKLVRIVYELAMKNVEDPKEKTKLLRAFLRVARDCEEFSADLVQSLKENLQGLGENPSDFDEEEDQQRQVPDDELFALDTEGNRTATNDEDGIRSIVSQEEAGRRAMNNTTEEGDNSANMNQKKENSSSVLDGFDPDDPELKQLLSKATLTENYDQRPLEDVLLVSVRQQKKQRKTDRASTAGPSWHSMPAAEMTDERRRDLEVVQMRDALDPAQHYKKPDREVLPKYFQVGHIIESKADFYTGRMPKRQRKRTMVEELMQDTEMLARNKRRFTAIVRRRETESRGAFQRHGALPKWSKRKNAKKR